jgi:hypothetical protein
MASTAFGLFARATAQVRELKSVATREEAAGRTFAADAIRRAALALSVASLDSYVHERGVELLTARALTGPAEATAVAEYLGHGLTAADVTGTSAEGLVRYGLSYKTLVAPGRLDELFNACGLDPAAVWLRIAVGLGSRPDRVRRQTELLYDRRNQIAHESDWDPIAFDFRTITEQHVSDCMVHVDQLVSRMEDDLDV